jgi:hypothetical protein
MRDPNRAPLDGKIMTDTNDKVDYSSTLYLPQTEFPMRAGLPQKEPEMAAKWKSMELYKKLRASAAGREKFVLHDGPPYANGNIHIGHALNKVLKDVITRSFQMRGYDANYVPGWDCHGLPIEWKIEEAYRAKGKDKNEVPVTIPQGMPRIRPRLDRHPVGGIPPSRHRGRFRPSLHHDELPRRKPHRRRTPEARHVRPALPRLQADHVVGRRAHGAGRSRGGVSRGRKRHDLGEVPGS